MIHFSLLQYFNRYSISRVVLTVLKISRQPSMKLALATMKLCMWRRFRPQENFETVDKKEKGKSNLCDGWYSLKTMGGHLFVYTDLLVVKYYTFKWKNWQLDKHTWSFDWTHFLISRFIVHLECDKILKKFISVILVWDCRINWVDHYLFYFLNLFSWSWEGWGIERRDLCHLLVL